MLSVEFGAMAPPLKKQVDGLKTPMILQASADAITRLHVHGLLNNRETHRARLRLVKAIEGNIKRDGGRVDE